MERGRTICFRDRLRPPGASTRRLPVVAKLHLDGGYVARSLNAKRLIAVCAAILLLALSAWIVAFLVFTNSDTWSEARTLLLTNKQYSIAPGSDVSPELIGFSYRFSGDYEAFQLNVHCKGSTDHQHFHAEFERRSGRLQLLSMRRD